jgi:NADPH:quinone reductase-like Zn-dependent oxidoreductase
VVRKACTDESLSVNPVECYGVTGPYFARIGNSSEDLGVLGELFEAGQVKPVIDRTYRLADAAEALAHLGGRPARGKVVITV